MKCSPPNYLSLALVILALLSGTSYAKALPLVKLKVGDKIVFKAAALTKNEAVLEFGLLSDNFYGIQFMKTAAGVAARLPLSEINEKVLKARESRDFCDLKIKNVNAKSYEFTNDLLFTIHTILILPSYDPRSEGKITRSYWVEFSLKSEFIRRGDGSNSGFEAGHVSCYLLARPGVPLKPLKELLTSDLFVGFEKSVMFLPNASTP